MIEPASHLALRQSITERILADRTLLDQLRAEVRILANNVRRIQPRNGTSISLVAADGGDTPAIRPFLIQLVRRGFRQQRYCLEAITPSTSIPDLSRRQFDGAGRPITALGRLMAFLGIEQLSQLGRFMEVDASGLATRILDSRVPEMVDGPFSSP